MLALIDAEQFHGFELLDVPDEEPAAPNALLVEDVVVIPASFPKTRALLEQRGFRVRTIDVSELQKAEAGVTCCSLIFNDETMSAFRADKRYLMVKRMLAVLPSLTTLMM